MAGLFDELLGGSGGQGLFGHLGGEDYDLGSRLAMAAAYLNDDPRTAAAIQGRMRESRREREERREKERLKAEQRRQYQAYMDSIGHPAADKTRDNPELLELIIPSVIREQEKVAEEKRAAEYAAQLQAEKRAYEETLEAKKPENVFREGMMGALERESQEDVSRLTKPWDALTKPVAGQVPDLRPLMQENDPLTYNMAKLPGMEGRSPQELAAFAYTVQGGDKPAQGLEKMSQVRDDVRQDAIAEMGGTMPNGMVIPGIGQGKRTESERRAGAIAAATRGLMPLREKFDALGTLPATAGSLLQQSESGVAQLAGQYLQGGGGAQEAYNNITGIVQNEVFSLSGATASAREFERLFRQVLPNSADDPGTREAKWNRLVAMKAAIMEGGQEIRTEYERAVYEFQLREKREPTKQERAELAAPIVAKHAQIGAMDVPPTPGEAQTPSGGFQITPQRQQLLDKYPPPQGMQ